MNSHDLLNVILNHNEVEANNNKNQCYYFSAYEDTIEVEYPATQQMEYIQKDKFAEFFSGCNWEVNSID